MESLAALAIVSITLVALVASLSTGVLAVKKMDKYVTAESLARAQLEYTKGQAYREAPASYDSIAQLPSSYSISTEASPIANRDADIQKVTVSVSYQGDELLAMEGYKMRR